MKKVLFTIIILLISSEIVVAKEVKTRFGFYIDLPSEFDTVAANVDDLLNQTKDSELKIDKEIKVPEVKAQPSLDVDRMLDAGDREPIKTTEKVSPRTFVPKAPEIADVKKDKLPIEPDPFNAAALLNTGSEISSKKSLNLFQRVTGIGKRGKELNNKTGEGNGEQDQLTQNRNNALSDETTAKKNTSERILKQQNLQKNQSMILLWISRLS